MLRKIEGKLTLLGNSESDDKSRTYTLFEVDGKPVLVTGKNSTLTLSTGFAIDNYLRQALEETGSVTIWIQEVAGMAVLHAIRLANGNTYLTYPLEMSDIAKILQFTMGVILTPFLGIGLIFLWMLYKGNKFNAEFQVSLGPIVPGTIFMVGRT